MINPLLKLVLGFIVTVALLLFLIWYTKRMIVVAERDEREKLL